MYRPGARRFMQLVLALLFSFYLPYALSSHGFHLRADPVLAASHSPRLISKSVNPQHATGTTITIDYPQNGAIFPHEITPPTFIWHDADAAVRTWRIGLTFSDGSSAIETNSHGEPMLAGEIDQRCVPDSNKAPLLSPELASAHTWKPSSATWSLIKLHSLQGSVRVTITDLHGSNSTGTQAGVRLSTSRDSVGAQIFYRDVSLTPSEGKRA